MAKETDFIGTISRSSPRSGRAPAFLKAVPLLHLAWPLFFGGWAQSAGAEYFYVDYSRNVNPVHLRLYDLSIISPDAEVDLTEGHKLGHRFFSYLSIGEVAADAPYREKAINRKIPFFGKNELWKSDLVDLSHPDWTRFVIELAGEAVQKHFDGFFLDTVDSVDLLIQKYPDRAEAFRSGLVGLIKKLKAAYPDKKIIVNRGFPVIDQLAGIVDGMLIESVFQTFDGTKKAYVAVAPSETEELLRRIQKVKAAGFAIYIIDYVDPGNPALAAETAKKIENLGYHALITTIDLQGRVLAPLAAKSRHLLALFGNQSSEPANSIKYPSDSFIAKNVQMVVEWLGYEVDYFNASSNLPPGHLEAKYCGIMLDRFLDISPGKEAALADWLLDQKARGSKLIVLGEIPFNQDEPRNRMLKALGMRGSGDLINHPGKLKIESLSEEMMNYETKVCLRPGNLRVLQAPVNSKVYLSIAVESREGQQHTFEPVFTAPWGGMVLDPFITFQRPDFHELWLLDPFKYFSAALEVDNGPVPDPTTRDGLRVFYSHIDGDGFGNKSVVETGKCAAEIIRDRIIKVYPVPITFSIIEAEIRGRVAGQKPEDEQKFRDIARSIFALTNVQAGSHTYTHPFFWIDDDRTASAYERQTLVLSGTNRQDGVDLKREIAGSVKFINEELLPPGKSVSIFLWSGNCRPPPEAIRLVKELGLENMNGGETLISARYPSISAVAPRVMPWDDQLQIYAANQNENEFNDGWKGPFHGGYIHTIETFKRTGTPRRLKPINIYYHLYCGDFHDALKVLCQAYEFALSQPIHAVTARQYTEIVRDSWATSIFKKSDNHWILMNEGKLRTFRVASKGVVPDLFKSKGVTGYSSGDGVLYIHTDGSPKVELVLSSHPPSHPYLISSSAEIEFQKLTASQVAFTASDLRPITVELGGLPAEAKLDVAVNQERRALRSDAKGRLTLALPRQAKVTLPVLLSAH